MSEVYSKFKSMILKQSQVKKIHISQEPIVKQADY